jgi:hypothetical protein
MTTPALPLDINAPGIVGDRPLRALQLIRIGRHPSQVMLVPAQGLWVVTGRGPEAGSNGAGKTVLLGALSLLLGDPQWNGGGGTGPSAARLLFDHDRAHATDSRYQSASLGYIAGVFCNAKSADPVSVWLQIERHSSPYVQVRWADGIYLAEGDSEAARTEDAETRWKELKANGTLTVAEYAARLYGDVPRCLASIRARGSEENQDRGLLALGHRSFRPADLATQIITLAGKAHALDTEREQRLAMQQNQESLDAQKSDYQQQYQRQEAELAQIARRKEARRLSGEAAEAWESYLTLLCLLEHHEAQALRASADALDSQVTKLKEAIAAKQAEIRDLPSREELLRARDDAKRRKTMAIAEKDKVVREEEKNKNAITTLESRISELEPRARLALGMTVAAAETAVSRAEKALQEAQDDHGAAKRELKSARDSLTGLLGGTGGPAGPAVAALRAAGIDSVPLLDLVTVPEPSRPAWEGRLSPYDRTVVVSRADADMVRTVLAAHPGTPVIACDGPIDVAMKASPEDPGVFGDLLRRLQERMPEASSGWIEDRDLGLAIGGGYDPPLADRKAAIAAAQADVDRLRESLGQQEERLTNATQAAARAKDRLAAAQAATELAPLQVTLAEVRRTAISLPARITAAQEQEETARKEFDAAETAYTNADQRRQAMQDELTTLRHGSSTPGGPLGLTQLTQAAADARAKASRKGEDAESVRLAAGLSDLAAAEEALAQSETILDHVTMQGRFHTACRLLRRATEEVLAGQSAAEPGQEAGDGRPLPALDHPGGASGKTHRARLSEELRGFHDWCDRAVADGDDTRPFDLVERPLRAWLDWNGSDDENRQAEILQDRIEQKRKMEAAEHKAKDTLLMLQEAQRLHIRTIEQMFQNTEQTLQDLLGAVERAPVALRARHTDIQDAGQWLRWEVSPQWLPAGRAPVDYRNPPNTAELIILHLLIAASALVSATAPRGRMLILDESGNNLDAPNLRRVSQALRQVADKYGLTMVLACQDLYTTLVSEHSTGVIQLVRASPADVLNAPPVILQQEDDLMLARSLEQYLQMGRPTGRTGPA